MKSLIEKAQGNLVAVTGELHVIRKIFHEENTASADLVNIGGIGRIGKAGVIKPLAFVLDRKCKLFIFALKAYVNNFAGIVLVAMIDGVVHSLSHRDHNIAVAIFIHIVNLANIINQSLYKS